MTGNKDAVMKPCARGGEDGQPLGNDDWQQVPGHGKDEETD